MPFTVTNLFHHTQTSQTQSWTSSTLTIPSDSIVFAMGHASQDGGVDWTTPPDINISDSVDGSTGWTAFDTGHKTGADRDFAGAGRAFYKSFTGSPANRTVTLTRNTGLGAYWGGNIVAVQGHNTSSPIVQYDWAVDDPNDGGNSHGITLTLDASPTSGNCVIFMLGVNNDSVSAASTPSGYTAIGSNTGLYQASYSWYHTATTTAAITSSDVGDGLFYIVSYAVEVALDGAPPAGPSYNYRRNPFGRHRGRTRTR